MEILEAEQFFGYPAQNPEFDSYLTANGIPGRPIFDGTPVARLSRLDLGVSLQFRSYHGYVRSYGSAAEVGEMIFDHIQAYGVPNDSGFEPYKGKLPFGVTLQTTLEHALLQFGPWSVTHPSGPNQVYVWYGLEGYTIALCMLPGGEGLSFFGLSRSSLEAPVQMDW